MIASRYRAWLEDGRPEDLEPELAPLLPALGAQARRLLRHASDADDAVQDAMVELLRTRRQIPAELPLPAVAHRLVWERAIMNSRSRQRLSRKVVALPEHLTAPGATSPTMGDPTDHAEVLTALSVREQALIAGLAGGGERKVLAARLGLSTAHVALILHRLRRRAAAYRRTRR